MFCLEMNLSHCRLLTHQSPLGSELSGEGGIFLIGAKALSQAAVRESAIGPDIPHKMAAQGSFTANHSQ